MIHDIGFSGNKESLLLIQSFSTTRGGTPLYELQFCLHWFQICFGLKLDVNFGQSCEMYFKTISVLEDWSENGCQSLASGLKLGRNKNNCVLKPILHGNKES